MPRGPRQPRPPLREDSLKELALAYVARFATSRAKLSSYLRRKLRERGWDGSGEPPVEVLVETAATAGFVDDSAFALAKARSLSARGYGSRRVDQALRAAGIEPGDGERARELASEEAVDSALRFARRRRFGPFAAQAPDARMREKQLAAMLRAGHAPRLAKSILDMPPGTDPTQEDFDLPM